MALLFENMCNFPGFDPHSGEFELPKRFCSNNSLSLFSTPVMFHSYKSALVDTCRYTTDDNSTDDSYLRYGDEFSIATKTEKARQKTVSKKYKSRKGRRYTRERNISSEKNKTDKSHKVRVGKIQNINND
ncbi:hypothetical protein [Acanthamoeba castellanii mimivirus]|jgi:hypothetical protein|uniref:Uncharacterized protein R547 n=4 Tax=Mimivirus TaxID=315393 RepID=YR547_MIMIV|nr:hypothetical protein MIMI_gp0589 [Acanthamoeba polyphaga mimivirus]Q5UR30.1 RecName: Full=Uncharacterized protein R547 [Acanthamoeba polyphaga mimivirus]ALR84136.1 hypothetical protein [Niemeyer virus]AMZ02991.1 hypothetical protein [Mimivirus Bombay]BAV61660.1 hypothetical protein [Acanthamoeba castellanii mimivirus]AAV50811.1 unknown [Acanthamoeba polyphaga mimivirus]ADO18698.1 hypothetical protein [Acanthamoeba polyphaga mimivirus]